MHDENIDPKCKAKNIAKNILHRKIRICKLRGISSLRFFAAYFASL